MRRCSVPALPSLPPGFSRLEPEQSIERPRARSTREQEDQDRRPGEMLGVGARVDEKLDRHDHAEERQGRQPRRQAGNEEEGAADLERRRYASRNLGRQDGHLVLVGEELHRQLPAGDLVEAGSQEDAGDRQTKHTLNDRDREAAEELGRRHDATPSACGAQHGRWVGEIAPTMSPSSSSSRSASVRSKLGSARRAAPTAPCRSRSDAKALRKEYVSAAIVRNITPSSRR